MDVIKMKKLEIREGDMQAVVGPGVIKNDLNAFLKPYGYLFGPVSRVMPPRRRIKS
jgi:FAD/FMN-containing dehydrogenase|eukprot:COSAG01_NODE_19642_length_998_cov_17.283648_1_plen_56_part_00